MIKENGETFNETLIEETDRLLRTVWKKYQFFLMPKESDVSLHQMLFLKYLEGKETCKPSEIAQRFGITLGAVTGFVDRLHRLGLITRTRSEEDRRVVLIKLSSKGIEILNAFVKERQLKFSRLYDNFDSLQLSELNKALEHLNKVLDESALS